MLVGVIQLDLRIVAGYLGRLLQIAPFPMRHGRAPCLQNKKRSRRMHQENVVLARLG